MLPGFTVEFAKHAAATAERLEPEARARLHMMLVDIAEVADLFSRRGLDPRSLTFSLGRVSVRYSIEPEQRTVTVQHVLMPAVIG